MGGCVIFGGTTEGRLLAEFCAENGFPADVYVATEYGASLLPASSCLAVHAGRLAQDAIAGLLKECGSSLCIDATHPYACAVSENIRKAAETAGVPCLRVRREVMADMPAPVFTAASMKEAVSFLAGTEGNILVTTGSKDLSLLSQMKDSGERCFVRVLPAAGSIEACREAGFAGRHVIAMQGPFSEEMNALLLKELDIRWLLTKDSGEEGGCPEKCRAAVRCGAGIVMIGRPAEEADALPLSKVKEMLADYCRSGYGGGQAEPVAGDGRTTEDDQEPGHDQEPGDAGIPEAADRMEAALVSMGPGRDGLLTAEAGQWLLTADVLCGGKRLLEEAVRFRAQAGVTGEVRAFVCISGKETASALQAAEPFSRAAVVCSGDISRYSLAKSARPLLEQRYRVRVFPGVSSVTYFLGLLGAAEEEVRVLSMHGRDADPVPYIRRERYVLTLSGGEDSVASVAETLAAMDLGHVRITVGTNLSFPDERIETGTAASFCGRKCGTLSLAFYENPEAVPVPAGFGLPDDAFVRGKVPMTKREIRCAALSRLALLPDDIVYDIGAGTGSVSVEAALHVPGGRVYAVERKAEALDLIALNRRRFACSNLIPVCGEAPDALAGLPAPDAVFIGGSGGRLEDILEIIFEKNPGARVAVTSVTAETDAAVTALMGPDSPYVCDRTEIWEVHERKAGGYHLRQAESPVSVVIIKRNG